MVKEVKISMRIFYNGENTVYLVPQEEWNTAKEKQIPGTDILEKMMALDENATRFECHDQHDTLCLMIPDLGVASTEDTFSRVLIFIQQGCLTFIYEPLQVIEDLAASIDELKYLSPDVPALFFSFLLRKDVSFLEGIEEEIANFEDLIATNPAKDIPLQISKLRFRLLGLKKYYDSLFGVLEDMENNENKLFSYEQLRSLHIQTNKVERLARMTQNLRDYVTQIREAYQAQLDIQLNSIMKVFTVITTIFLPLTLIVGWYGMNLRMPEVHYLWTYPLVIVLSIGIVLASIIFFKRKSWF